MDLPRFVVPGDDRARTERIRRRAAPERVTQRDDPRAVAQQDLEAHLFDELADAVHRLVRLDGRPARGLHLGIARARPGRLEHRIADQRHDLGLVQRHPGGTVPPGELGGGEELEALLLPRQQAHPGIVASGAIAEAPMLRSAAASPGDEQRKRPAHEDEARRQDDEDGSGRMRHRPDPTAGSRARASRPGVDTEVSDH